MVKFVAVRADTLIGLSNSVLVSPTAWREVARINKLADPNRILPGSICASRRGCCAAMPAAPRSSA